MGGLQDIYSLLPRIRNVRITNTPDASYPHSVIIPWATYSPWLRDPEFLAMFKIIEGHTLVDLYRCYDLWMLLEQASKAGPGDIIEVGVWRGGTACLLAHRAKQLSLPGSVIICDTFEGVPSPSSYDPSYRGGEHADTSVEIVHELFTSAGLGNPITLRGCFPATGGEQIGQHKFVFAHIDVDIYQSAKDVGEWIWPRLCPGGMVVFDDYGFMRCEGVTRAVDEMSSVPDAIFIHNLNGHAILIKTAHNNSPDNK
jgi:O-methyltransferase